MLSHFWIQDFVLLAVGLFLAQADSFTYAEDKPQPHAKAVDRGEYRKMVSDAIDHLKSLQRQDGSFSDIPAPGITSLVTTALLKQGLSPDDPFVKKSLQFVEKLARDDGGIYAANSIHRNYETCLAIMCLADANIDGRYDKQIANADGFIKNLQWKDEDVLGKDEFAPGGAGYGKHKRPDLSNTSFLIEALRASGNAEDDPSIQAALEFVSRVQNLESEHNTTSHAALINDGGFYYTAAAGGSSQAGELPNGGLRSYGSMTYAGLKSMLFAGVEKDDPRVVAAVEWIGKNFTLDRNPGMPEHLKSAGLYYYFHMFAKALDAIGGHTFIDESGVEHDWRSELVSELQSRQQANGGWINTENEKWLENDSALVTGYALLALSYCQSDDSE